MMSSDQMKAFVDAVAQDSELQAKISALPEDDREAALEQGLQIARDAGFDLSADEGKTLMEEYSEDRELSEEELTQVGGCGNAMGGAGPK